MERAQDSDATIYAGTDIMLWRHARTDAGLPKAPSRALVRGAHPTKLRVCMANRILCMKMEDCHECRRVRAPKRAEPQTQVEAGDMEERVDPLRALFESLAKNGAALLDEAVAEGWQEDLRLDFKTLANNAAPMTKTDKKNLAEALSGFANSDGGLIVWGIDARSEGGDDPDTAKEKRPIANLNLFLSDLHRLTAHVVSPAIVGVEHIVIPEEAASDAGYAVTFVPKSDGLPHMARAEKQHTFYFRSGSSFLPMEPFMLADRYGRRPQPKLEFDWRIEPGGVTKGAVENVEVRIFFGIKNSGCGIALYPAIVIHRTPSFRINPDNFPTGLPEKRAFLGQSDAGRRIFGGGADYAVYPGTTLEVTCGSCNLKPGLAKVPDVEITYELYCDGDSCTGQVTVPIDEVYQNMTK